MDEVVDDGQGDQPPPAHRFAPGAPSHLVQELESALAGSGVRLPEAEVVEYAIRSLGLRDVTDFDPQEKIIEYIVAEAPDEPLANLSLRGFIE